MLKKLRLQLLPSHKLRVGLFDYELPESLIALKPAEPRGSARMLVIEPAEFIDSAVSEFPQYLREGDVVVFNNSTVIPARLMGKRGDTTVEILLHKQQADRCWSAFAKPAKKLKVGDVINFREGLAALIQEKRESGEVVLQFSISENADFFNCLQETGQMPLPPYIQKKRAADETDVATYQTIYADQNKKGSVAAPTAGLHFTDALLQQIGAAGAEIAYVTLHVGAGTFQPVKVEETTDHLMHTEWAEVTAKTARIINDAKARGGRVVAVGTTSLRVLESAADEQGVIQPYLQETDIFITPGYRFKAVDVLLTNFHLPRSTLLMLVCAFAGLERMLAAYQHAIASGYRFYSYGDACLLFRKSE